jgi:hypothetical protein
LVSSPCQLGNPEVLAYLPSHSYWYGTRPREAEAEGTLGRGGPEPSWLRYCTGFELVLYVSFTRFLILMEEALDYELKSVV